jgi:hypothetical protein
MGMRGNYVIRANVLVNGFILKQVSDLKYLDCPINIYNTIKYNINGVFIEETLR